MLKVDFMRVFNKIPGDSLRFYVLDKFMEAFVPFSRWLGLHIEELNEDEVQIYSPDRVRRRNHVGSAHACALALLAEYPAGMVLAQKYPPSEYRIIIMDLKIQYHKQGRGVLRSCSKRPSRWPSMKDGEVRMNMTSEIFNAKDEIIATCKTIWQVKAWS